MLTEEPDVIRAIISAVHHVKAGKHDPQQTHERVKEMYTWQDVARRTETIYRKALLVPQVDIIERWSGSVLHHHIALFDAYLVQILWLWVDLWQNYVHGHRRRLPLFRHGNSHFSICVFGFSTVT